MFGRRRETLLELIRSQREESTREHEETMAYLRGREEESEQRVEEMKRESKRRDEEMREFNREILLRNEKVYTNVILRLEEMGREIRSNTEETKAQTQALLRLIDRFDEGGGAAAA